MKTIILGTIIIFISILAVGAVCLAFALSVIKAQRQEYEGLLAKRRRELQDAKRDNERLSLHNAQLEAAASLTRINTPQAEFFTVPKRVTR